MWCRSTQRHSTTATLHGHGNLVVANRQGSQPNPTDDMDHLVIDFDGGDVTMHFTENLGADGAFVNHGRIDSSDVTNADVVDILVGFGGVVPWSHGCSSDSGGLLRVGRTDLQKVLDHFEFSKRKRSLVVVRWLW